MGAEPWEYFVPYEPDIQAALHKLRQREFAGDAAPFVGLEGLLEDFVALGIVDFQCERFPGKR